MSFMDRWGETMRGAGDQDFGHEAQTRIQQLRAENSRLADNYNALVDKNSQDINDYNALLQKFNAKKAENSQNIKDYNALSDRFNALVDKNEQTIKDYTALNSIVTDSYSSLLQQSKENNEESGCYIKVLTRRIAFMEHTILTHKIKESRVLKVLLLAENHIQTTTPAESWQAYCKAVDQSCTAWDDNEIQANHATYGIPLRGDYSKSLNPFTGITVENANPDGIHHEDSLIIESAAAQQNVAQADVP